MLERRRRLTLRTDLRRWTLRRSRRTWLITLEIDGITVERWGLWEVPDDPNMLSLSEVHAALEPRAAGLSNAELRKLRDQADRLLRALSDSRWFAQAPFDRRLVELPEDRRDAIVERAAILEYEAGVEGATAEEIAFEGHFQSKRVH